MSRFYFLVFALLSLLPTSAFPMAPEGCGLFRMQGTIQIRSHLPALVVAPGTRSETIITLTGKRQIELTGFLDQKLLLEGTVSQPIRNTRGELEVKSYSLAVPDYLDPGQGDGIWVLKKSACAAPKK